MSRAAPPPGAARGKARIVRPAKSLLADEESAALRDRLIAELDDLTSADEAANWVHRRMPDKNLLTKPDGQLVESRFTVKLEAFAGEEAQEPSREAGQVAPEPDPGLDVKNGVGAFAEVPEEICPSTAESWARPFACAIRSTPDSYPASPASCAAARRPTRIIFDSRSPARSDERSATNTRSPSVARIIANCIVMATRRRGGRGSTSIPFQSRSGCGDERDQTKFRDLRACSETFLYIFVYFVNCPKCGTPRNGEKKCLVWRGQFGKK